MKEQPHDDIPGFGPLSPEHKAQGWLTGLDLLPLLEQIARQKSDNRKKERFER
jgi:hypothetical protein